MKETIKEISNFIQKQRIGTVVGLDGYSGLGKTTISNQLEIINSNIKVVHMDDYVTTSNTKENLEPQLENNADELKLEWTDVKRGGFIALVEDIKKYTDKIILVEGIFLSHSDVLPGIFNQMVFLDGDEELADKRRIVREKERWGDEYFPETHPDSFVRLFKLAWQRYKELYCPEEKANLVVSV